MGVVLRGSSFARASEILSEETQEAFAASVIASVIALGKSENGRESTNADEESENTKC